MIDFVKHHIDKTSPVPLYFQIKEIILSEILSGNLQTGDLIPTEVEFSQMYKVSRSTVRQAILELVNEGYLCRLKSKGKFVSKPKISQEFVYKLDNFRSQMARAGLEPKTEVLEFEVINPTDSIMKALEITEDDKVIKLSRLRYAGSDPIVIVDTYLPYELCAPILKMDMSVRSLTEFTSLDPQTEVVRAKRTIEAINAGPFESRHLRIKRGHAVLQFRTTGYNCYDRPVEYSIARYRGDRNKFTVSTVNTSEEL